MEEAIKVVGGVMWVLGVLLLLVEPFFGVVALAVAVLATVATVTRTRARRHQELLDAVRND